MDFIVDESLRDYMWQPDAECYAKLEELLVAEGGPRDPLVVAELPNGKRYLIDGHRRYDICQKNGLKYEVDVICLKSMAAIKAYMDSLQLSRRNLSPQQHVITKDRLSVWEEGLKAEWKKKCEAVAEVAKEHGVSPRTVWRDKQYTEALKALPDDIRETVLSNKIGKDKVVKLSKMPKEKQVEALHTANVKSFEDAFTDAGRELARMQNNLEWMNTSKPNIPLLKKLKAAAKGISEGLDMWNKA